MDVKALTSFVNDHQLSLSKICEISAADVLSSTVEIMYQDTSVIRAIWVNLFLRFRSVLTVMNVTVLPGHSLNSYQRVITHAIFQTVTILLPYY